MLKKFLWNSFLLDMLPEILEGVDEIRSFQVFCKKVFCQKGVLNNFRKFSEKRLYLSLFFNNVASWRPELYPKTLLKKT